MTSATETTSSTHTLHVGDLGPIELTVSERGHGRPLLLMHGGAGPQSVTNFADLMAENHEVRVITPTHPGFGGTPRPESLANPAGLAALYGERASLNIANAEDGGVVATVRLPYHEAESDGPV